LQDDLKKFRKEHEEEEKKLLGVKKNSEDVLTESIKYYDQLMEDWTREKSKMMVNIILAFKRINNGMI
jgi:hypothetical protein